MELHFFEQSVKDAVTSNQLFSNMDITALSARLGKSPSTLYRELNPNDRAAKLGLLTTCEIIKETNNYRLMNLILDYTELDRKKLLKAV